MRYNLQCLCDIGICVVQICMRSVRLGVELPWVILIWVLQACMFLFLFFVGMQMVNLFMHTQYKVAVNIKNMIIRRGKHFNLTHLTSLRAMHGVRTSVAWSTN